MIVTQDQIARRILDALAKVEKPVDEVVLHMLSDRPPPLQLLESEFRDALENCKDRGLVVAVRDGLGKVLWSLTNKGKAERHA